MSVERVSMCSLFTHITPLTPDVTCVWRGVRLFDGGGGGVGARLDVTKHNTAAAHDNHQNTHTHSHYV